MLTKAKERLLSGSVLDAEIKLEARSVEEGVLRYRRMAEIATRRGDGAGLKPAERMLVHWYQPMLAEVREELRAIESGAAAVGRAIYGPVLSRLDAERITVITIREMLGKCMAKPAGLPSASMSQNIGAAIIAEIHTDIMAEMDRVAIKKRNARIAAQRAAGIEPDMSTQEQYPEESKVLRTMEMVFRRAGPARRNWWAKRNIDDPIEGRRVAMHVGNLLMWMLIGVASAGPYDKPFQLAFHARKVREGNKTRGMVKIDNAVVEIINAGHEVRELLRPRYLPMLVEPMVWQTVTEEDDKGELVSKTIEGGYVQIRTPFVSKPARSHKAALSKADLSEVYQALAAVNSTPLRVNKRVLAIQKKMYSRGGGACGLPYESDIPPVPRPEGYRGTAPLKQRWSSVSKEDRQAYHDRQGPINRSNYLRRAERFGFERIMTVADSFADIDQFWQPHQLDFRGRAYPIPQPLNHQSHDVCRGMIEFAEGVCPNPKWLAIQAANSWGRGVDKVSFAERIKWVEDHASMIEETVSDPMDHEWWHGAKKPWQFLAACYAVCDPARAGRHLGVNQDGSANGIQHYTAMSRDGNVAPLVNMVRSDVPADIYAVVADLVKVMVASDKTSNQAIAKLALDHCVRDVTKPTTMTDTYGVTMIGARKQVRAQLAARGVVGTELYKLSRYISQTILDAIHTLCPSAKAIMSWLQECARLIAGAGKLVTWKTPLGFPVVQSYRLSSPLQIKTAMGSVSIEREDDSTPVAIADQCDGIAPNYVHSIDATHMFMTARACRAAGVRGLFTHDCYITHSGTCNDMAVVTRAEFIKLHSADLLGDLLAQFQASFGLDFPDRPARGTFDLELVRSSPYFFS